MPKKAAATSRGGAPRKAPDGLDKVLFIRADEELVAKLEALRKKYSDQKDVTLSRSDVVRLVLKDAFDREEEGK